MIRKVKGQNSKVKSENKEEIEVLRSQLARALADYDNFRKRTERERDALGNLLTGKVVSRFLPALDMLYEAQKHLKDSGLALTINAFEEALKAEGIEKIEPEAGDGFSEDLHEAVEVVNKEGVENNKISECVMRGWRFAEGNVIRHAKVIVNKVDSSK